MDWLRKPLLRLGRAHVSLVTLAEFAAALAAVVLVARLLRWLVGTRLLGLTGLPAGPRYAIGQFTY